MIWIQCSTRLLSQGALQNGEKFIFHASNQTQSTNSAGIRTLVPLFFEKADTIQMVRHGLIIMRETAEKFNTELIPVMAADQPLFALFTYVQWTWPDTFGEASFSIMLHGRLDAEMASCKMVRDFREATGQLLCLMRHMRASLLLARRTLS